MSSLMRSPSLGLSRREAGGRGFFFLFGGGRPNPRRAGRPPCFRRKGPIPMGSSKVTEGSNPMAKS